MVKGGVGQRTSDGRKFLLLFRTTQHFTEVNDKEEKVDLNFWAKRDENCNNEKNNERGDEVNIPFIACPHF